MNRNPTQHLPRPPPAAAAAAAKFATWDMPVPLACTHTCSFDPSGASCTSGAAGKQRHRSSCSTVASQLLHKQASKQAKQAKRLPDQCNSCHTTVCNPTASCGVCSSCCQCCCYCRCCCCCCCWSAEPGPATVKLQAGRTSGSTCHS